MEDWEVWEQDMFYDAQEYLSGLDEDDEPPQARARANFPIIYNINRSCGLFSYVQRTKIRDKNFQKVLQPLKIFSIIWVPNQGGIQK